ncbi:hypothetical protein [Paenibacillus illinoisensis]|uniref:hypothetical protein n=1 Tax=Paenibacillus illinoisensis TaxID=59845 RepID=UPI003015DEE1
MIKTNIDEILNHLKQMHKEVLRTESFKQGAKGAGEAMKARVVNSLSSSGYDYLQSGTLLRVVKGDVPHVEVNKTGTKAQIGFGDIDELNMETKRGPQRGIFTDKDGATRSIGLRPEPSLPAWIIMEFGRRAGGGAGAKGIPKAFQVPYTARDSSKQFLYGPSQSYHFNKRILFMTNKTDGRNRMHPGVRAGHFFRDGLRNSQDDVRQLLGDALKESMKEVAGRYGWRVV